MNAYILPGLDSRNINYSNIQQIVEDHFKLDRYSLIRKTRLQEISVPRQIAMYFTRKYTGHTFPQIGKAFGKHHATVIYACRMVQNIIDVSDVLYSDHVIQIETKIKNHITNQYDHYKSYYPVKHSSRLFQEVPAPLAAGQ